MKIKKIAAFSILPAALAGGVALTTGLTAHSTADHQGAQGRALPAADYKGRKADQTQEQKARHTAHAGLVKAAKLRREVAAQQRRAHQHRAQQRQAKLDQAQTPTAASAPGRPLTAGMSSFEQCVAWRESSDTPTDPAGLFGILPATWASLGYPGTAGQASVALQEEAFNRLYAEYGTQPWAPYDGC